MILRYWGERGLTADSFAHLLDRSASGIRTDALVDDLKGRGWNALTVTGNGETIDREMELGRPVLALIEDRPGTFHYVVIVASLPEAIVFHDPARAPFRVMERSQFERRWSKARSWMAVVVPAAPPGRAPSAPVALSADTSCSALVAEGVRAAQANDLSVAEQSLTRALSCGGSAPLRELAGVRLLQQRWPEVGELARAALAVDDSDTHAWELLATSRFVQGDADGALEAWNRVDRPRVDLVSFGGLTRTRQPVVERLLDVPPESLLTRRRFAITDRRLRELPSASSTRLEYIPAASGLAELRAHVVERPIVPRDPWSYTAMGVVAAVRNEVRLSTGAITGGGERITAGWRFWPNRPRVDVQVTSPAPWGGIWALDAFAERQPFTDETLATQRHSGVGATLTHWIAPWLRVSSRGGLDNWVDRGRFATARLVLRVASPRDSVSVDFAGAGWAGDQPFASASMSMLARVEMSGDRRLVTRAGAGVVSPLTPAELWWAGDAGQTRPVLLRAHPLVESGRLKVERLGRTIVHGSFESQQWWRLSPQLRFAAAAFVDAAEVSQRMRPGARGDVDAGLGVRVASPGFAGMLRLDIAKGLVDGATAVSVVYEP